MRTAENIRNKFKKLVLDFIRCLRGILFCFKNFCSVVRFIFTFRIKIALWKKITIVTRIYRINYAIKCPHSQHEIFSFITAFLSVPPDMPGCIVEAGCYKGGSTSKFSIAAQMVERRLIVFDSFKGIPDNSEPHEKNIFGGNVKFPKGSYCGTLEEVEANITKWGEIQVCTLVEGWFENTMPNFSENILAAYLDVDLAASTRTCIRYLWPRIVPGGILFSQDGHLPLIIDVFNDDKFWEQDVGCKKPYVLGLGKKKLIKIFKPFDKN